MAKRLDFFLDFLLSKKSSEKSSRLARALQPHDQVTVDRRFNIRDLLALYQCSLTIRPSKHGGLQMSNTDVQDTSRIASVRIYVEQPIRRKETFGILNRELSITLLPLAIDIISVFSTLQLLPPLSVLSMTLEIEEKPF